MILFKQSLILIFFLVPKIVVASQWIEGNKLVIQGLDKITARIQSFEVNVGETHKFGVLDIYVERCIFSKPLFIDLMYLSTHSSYDKFLNNPFLCLSAIAC